VLCPGQLAVMTVCNSPYVSGIVLSRYSLEGGHTMRVISALAIACAIALPAHAQQQQITAPKLFSIRGGETLLLRPFGWITIECVSMFGSLEGIDGDPEIRTGSG
jgi:hypothetical protein